MPSISERKNAKGGLGGRGRSIVSRKKKEENHGNVQSTAS